MIEDMKAELTEAPKKLQILTIAEDANVDEDVTA